MAAESSVSAKEQADRLLADLGESLSVEGLSTDANGLARLSGPGLGMVDFELYDEQRVLGLFVNVGSAPDDASELLRLPLDHGEMAGFWFGLDGFKTQVYLSAALPVDGVSKETVRSTYDRFVQCGTYWLENLDSESGGGGGASDLEVPGQAISA